MNTNLFKRFVAATLAIVMVLLMGPVSPMEVNAVGTTYVLNVSTDLEPFKQEVKADGDTQKAGTNNYFTLIYSTKTKVDGNKKDFGDGFVSTQRLSFGGKSVIGDTTKNAIQIKTGSAATVKVWWVQQYDTAKDTEHRQVAIFDASGNVVTKTDDASDKNAMVISELKVTEAGTYYIGNTPNNNNIYKVEVTEDAPAQDVTEPSTEATTVATTVATTEATTVATTEATTVPTTEPTTAPTVPAEYDPSKIDVWDFGAEQLDTAKYNNMLTVDEINGWYPSSIVPGSMSNDYTLGDFATTDGQMKFVGGGKTNHRLRTTNTALTRRDEKSLKDADGKVYSGYIYSNSTPNPGVQIQITAQAGDILTFVHGSNGGDAVTHFEAPSGKVVDGTFTAGSASAQVSTYYAAETGTYSFYYSTEKLVVARIYRQHTSKVTVSGSVTAPTTLSGYSLVFTCNESGAQIEAPVTGGAYTAQLSDTYSYTVSLKNANGYIITTADTLTVPAGSANLTFDATVMAVSQVTVTGKITGLDEAALANLKLSFKSDAIYVPEVKITGDTYTVKPEMNVAYEVVAEGINDYQLTSSATVSYMADGTADITFGAKPTYPVTIAPTGATLADLAGATFTFTNLKEEGYTYEFTGTDNIALRDGTYSVKVSNSGIYVQQLTSNLTVAGAAVTKEIPFDGNVSQWDFRVEDYTGQASYNGLALTGSIKKHGAQYGLAITGGTIAVPVPGPCEVKVSVGYNWDISFDDSTETFTDNTNSGDKDISYSYSGAAGTVTIHAGNTFTSYIKKIEIVETVAYKSTVTVGASGCDYTTINDALAAVRAMERPNNERVTIEIQPGDYEEMLVIDMPNVTLKNASTSPSLELTNKGVDIASNAVRITSYYGHGYSYYSMGPDCKWNETILKVNKDNGYESFTNPGSGTTSGSYWNATVVVSGDGFQAEGIIFENSFNQYVSKKAANDVIVAQTSAKEGSTPRASLSVGSTAVQDKAYVERAAALAIANNTDHVSFDNCKFIGRQDTLYGGTGVTAAFYDCSVYGACDYIFGGMTAVFAKCDLVFNTSENSNDRGYITAPQTASGSHGLLMYNCYVTSTVPGKDTASAYASKPGYFGRPWAAGTGEAVFDQTVVGATDSYWYEQSPSLIMPDGWLNSLSGESALCGEYGTYEYAKDVDNSAKRASWAAVFTEEKLASGEPISVDTWFGEWKPFAGKDMNVVIPSDKVDNKPAEQETPPAQQTTYVLNVSTDLEPFKQEAKADGDTQKAGTDGYFTVIYSKKTKIDPHAKTFDDGFTSTHRLSFGGKADFGDVTKNAIQIKTGNPATVKVWWVQQYDNTKDTEHRQVAIFDASGNVVTKTEDASDKNAMVISELELTEAGTYYIGNTPNNNNIYKIEVTETAAVVAEPKEYVLNVSTDLEPFKQEAKADGDTQQAGTDGYFTVIYSKKTKIDPHAKTFDDGFTSTHRLSFGGKADFGDVTKNAIQIKTGSAATVKVWWVQQYDNTKDTEHRQVAIFDASGNVVTKTNDASDKNAMVISELELTEAGTYYIGNTPNNNNIYKIVVTEAGGAITEPERADWATVAEPAISVVADDGEGNMKVTVSALVGDDGGDQVVVTMYDAAGNEIASKRSIAEKGEHILSFTPEASGEYTFKAVLSREGETDKVSAAATGSFVLPLKTPLVSSATSNGGGKVNVVWGKVDEATGYNVYCDGVKVGFTEKTEYEVHGLTVGTTHTFTVSAVRGEEETAQSAASTATATEKAQRVWGFTTYGSSTSASANGYTGSVNEGGKVTVYSEGGKGKIVPNSTDGVAFYYTAVPTNYNFTLRANVHVDSWKLSNGQEGFGLLATDRLGTNGDGSSFWNNSYMAAATKNEYRYDSETGIFYDQSMSYMGTKYSMKIGLATIAKTGVTPENLAKMEAGDTETITGQFSSVSDTLERYASMEPLNAEGKSVNNIVGNMSNSTSAGVINSKNLLTDFVLEIQKNNTGYFITYYDMNGNVIRRIKNYEPDALNKLDSENVYVGFFAARNARATFSNIHFSTILASEDAPAEQRPITYVEPTLTINSASSSNTPEYTVSLYSNVSGTADISVNGVSVAKGVVMTAEERSDTVVTLPKVGTNTVRVYFYPDPDQELGEYTELANSNRVYQYKYVRYWTTWRKRDVIYVSPKGTSDVGKGTREDPLDIYTAVQHVRAGQTIILMEGTYLLRNTVRIEHGIDGTADTPIKMIADPEAKTRPVLNFRGVGGGLVTGGDYWYFQGFDVTNTAPGQKGFNLCGHYNIVDQVNTYNNGNTGLQISRYQGSDPKSEWPSNNLILNCTSYNNSDPGYEDADGFACKLTAGEGNVFDGCVAYNNADDGWDLYAKVESGNIGSVTIQNCVAYQNGYVIENGVLVNGGNGNGFKMGGESLSGKHVLKNSYAFFNKAKGIDSNSCPDIIVKNCTSYNNEGSNVAFYTNNAANTDFSATGIVSFKDETIKSGLATGENLKPKGSQDASKYTGDTNYYWSGSASTNTTGATVTADDFVSLTFQGVKRNADGTINMQGFLELKEGSNVNAGAGEGGTASPNPSVDPDKPVNPSDPTQPTTPSDPSDPTKPTTPSDPSDPTKPTTPADPSNPGTGDLGNPALWIVMMVVAAAALVVFTILYRKRSYQA